MRGDIALQLRLAVRPRGVLGVVTVVAGIAAVAAVYLPWYELFLRVRALGRVHAGPIGTTPGWQAQPWIWLVPAIGVAVVVLGVAVAVDRPPRHVREAILVGAVGVALLTGASALTHPPEGRFGAQDRLERVRETAADLPEGVVVDLGVRPATGIWVALASSALLLATAFSVREA